MAISFAGPSKGFLSSTARSARIPGSMEPASSSWFEDGFGLGLLLVNAAILVGGAYSVATTVLALPPLCFP